VADVHRRHASRHGGLCPRQGPPHPARTAWGWW
jgi:hypothetical protein